MDAMIFAAGLGTRMRPLTDTMPKALVPLRGRPLIEHVLDRLPAGRVVVNTCPFAEQMEQWARGRNNVVLSPEPGGPYDTGGGLVHAAPLFTGEGPIILHAVDVLSDIPLDALLAAHASLATLAVQNRPASRKLLFDDNGLMGWRGANAERLVREPTGLVSAMGFAGIHVIARELFKLTARRGTFPIVDLYLDLAAQGHVIRPYDVTDCAWLDVGTPEKLAAAERLSGGSPP